MHSAGISDHNGLRQRYFCTAMRRDLHAWLTCGGSPCRASTAAHTRIRCTSALRILPESPMRSLFPSGRTAGPHTGILKPGPSRGLVFLWPRARARSAGGRIGRSPPCPVVAPMGPCPAGRGQKDPPIPATYGLMVERPRGPEGLKMFRFSHFGGPKPAIIWWFDRGYNRKDMACEGWGKPRGNRLAHTTLLLSRAELT